MNTKADKEARGCPECNSGFIYYYDDEGSQQVKMCECEVKRQYEESMRRSGISKSFATKTLDSMDTEDEEMANAVNTCKRYVSQGVGSNLVITGNVGTGKTRLAIGTANELLSKGIRVRYVGYRELVGELKPLAMETRQRNKAINKYKNIQVLVIDDLYKSNVTDADIALIYEIINFRYMNDKETIITSELGVHQLMEIDEAIITRLMEESTEYYINLKGKNRRLK